MSAPCSLSLQALHGDGTSLHHPPPPHQQLLFLLLLPYEDQTRGLQVCGSLPPLLPRSRAVHWMLQEAAWQRLLRLLCPLLHQRRQCRCRCRCPPRAAPARAEQLVRQQLHLQLAAVLIVRSMRISVTTSTVPAVVADITVTMTAMLPVLLLRKGSGAAQDQDRPAEAALKRPEATATVPLQVELIIVPMSRKLRPRPRRRRRRSCLSVAARLQAGIASMPMPRRRLVTKQATGASDVHTVSMMTGIMMITITMTPIVNTGMSVAAVQAAWRPIHSAGFSHPWDWGHQGLDARCL